MSGLVGGVLNCWAKKQKSVALSSTESEQFAAITPGTRSLEIQSELMDSWVLLSCHSCDTQSERVSLTNRDSVATAAKHVRLRGLWLQEALGKGKSELDKVDAAIATSQSFRRVHEGVT